MFGELVPVGGGDPIPLLKVQLTIGRREDCDIVLRFPNVSGKHCQLTLTSGYWYLQDLESRNGCKVNNQRVKEKRLDPGDELAVAKHRYTLQYSPSELGAVGPPPPEDNSAQVDDIFSKSLLERAGLVKRVLGAFGGGKSNQRPGAARDGSSGGRFDVSNNAPGQIKNSNRPV